MFKDDEKQENNLSNRLAHFNRISINNLKAKQIETFLTSAK